MHKNRIFMKNWKSQKVQLFRILCQNSYSSIPRILLRSNTACTKVINFHQKPNILGNKKLKNQTRKKQTAFIRQGLTQKLLVVWSRKDFYTLLTEKLQCQCHSDSCFPAKYIFSMYSHLFSAKIHRIQLRQLQNFWENPARAIFVSRQVNCSLRRQSEIFSSEPERSKRNLIIFKKFSSKNIPLEKF